MNVGLENCQLLHTEQFLLQLYYGSLVYGFSFLDIYRFLSIFEYFKQGNTFLIFLNTIFENFHPLFLSIIVYTINTKSIIIDIFFIVYLTLLNQILFKSNILFNASTSPRLMKYFTDFRSPFDSLSIIFLRVSSLLATDHNKFVLIGFK